MVRVHDGDMLWDADFENDEVVLTGRVMDDRGQVTLTIEGEPVSVDSEGNVFDFQVRLRFHFQQKMIDVHVSGPSTRITPTDRSVGPIDIRQGDA